MGKTLNDFCEYLEGRVGHSLYVLGAQGQSIRQSIEKNIYQFEQTYSRKPDDNLKRTMALLDKMMPQDIYFYDCSGLGLAWLIPQGLVKSDMTADKMYRDLCSNIAKDALKRGDWVFIRDSSSGIITHVGYVTDNALSVVEAAGRDYGVIKRNFKQGSPNGAWNVFGRPNRVFTGTEQVKGKPEAQELPASQDKKSRVLRLMSPLMTGDDVKELQTALVRKGIAVAADGMFGASTEKAVLQAQKRLWPNQPAKWDGLAGSGTAAGLGIVWKA